jgi:hypothetical protein
MAGIDFNLGVGGSSLISVSSTEVSTAILLSGCDPMKANHSAINRGIYDGEASRLRDRTTVQVPGTPGIINI